MTTAAQLLRSNVLKAIRKLNDGPLPEPPGWPKNQFLVHGGLSLTPAFHGTPRDIRCFQQDVFGFYVLRMGLRSALLSVNYLNASDHLIKREYYGPAVLCAYSSVFQCIHGWLALHGRSFIDPAYWPMSSETSASTNAKTMLATLTRSNQWHFHVSKRTHEARWYQLQELTTADHSILPSYFEFAFDALYREGRCPNQDLDDLLREGRSKPLPLSEILEDPSRLRRGWSTAEDVLKDFFSEIATARHDAVYNSFGNDPFLTEALVNDDAAGGDLGARAKLFWLFANELLFDTAQQWSDILSAASPTPEVHKWIYVCTHFPWFDGAKVEKLKPARLRAMVTSLKNAIRPRD